MLDTFEILTTSGVVLWSRSYVPVSSSVVNTFIADVFIEERRNIVARVKDNESAAENPPYNCDQHTLRWTFAQDLGVIFVVVYRSLLQLSWIDRLLDNIKIFFVNVYGDQLKKTNTTIIECLKFDDYFDQQLRELETLTSGDNRERRRALEEETSSNNVGDESSSPPEPVYRTLAAEIGSEEEDQFGEWTAIATPNNSHPASPNTSWAATPGSHVLGAKPGPVARISRRSRKAKGSSAQVSSGDESPGKKAKAVKPAKTSKKGRRWDADGAADDDDDNVQLDYSGTTTKTSDSAVDVTGRSAVLEEVASSAWGTKASGKFILKDFDHQVASVPSSSKDKANANKNDPSSSAGLVGASLGAIGGLFRDIVGGKVLSMVDLVQPLKGMEEHLLKKNVAREAAVRLCEGVAKELIGIKTANLERTSSRIRSAMEASLSKMLTPSSSLDLLREIDLITAPSVSSLRKPRPYVISIVGVNGVGKSTNLSKICFFLLQNKYRVLIVAGDTFRSGAVEQLGVHVRNLKELTAREGGTVELYQKGYGKDAATVAKDAVKFAAQESFEVVLIDTAGRRHNDQRLMSSLEKFAKFAQPDKILMVGEALVGTDSVAQAKNFNAAFGSGRSLDGFIISKCDTVGDMVGTLVSLVHATNVPIIFVGVGQHYSDLRNFSVTWAIEKLLS